MENFAVCRFSATSSGFSCLQDEVSEGIFIADKTRITRKQIASRSRINEKIAIFSKRPWRKRKHTSTSRWFISDRLYPLSLIMPCCALFLTYYHG